ncbi:MAG: DNA mismatch repair protein MutS [Candidatus Cloacimonetes bacterium]|nr:DNA mismatch repair protein MutS [Candidatus Cloacimonadota bacterium]MCF7813778.1 DNA mismatch repair protein MutS [Candidatus Cloacimonadota bacterium]MCF7868350.1 DNA mismatch repair protein MutS [Candidatus Cloacimonadota bacterium]MCF7883824.1 DNA mismatch repair protein MutS [Candidatus Cloacimonadota bacterium]
MLKQFMQIKDKHPDKLLLFRMGDFYETFFEDAKTASKILGITLTARDKKADDPIPLAGFPHHALNNYLDKLVKAGMKIVICEQMEDPKLAKGLVKRDIVDIITPGSIIDGNLIESTANNYLAVIYKPENKSKTGLALLDVSTADFLFTELENDQLANELIRFQTKEIIVQNEEMEVDIQKLKLEPQPTITVFDNWYFDTEEADRTLKSHFGITTLEGLGARHKPLGRTAAGVALSYIKSLKNDNLKHISNLRFYSLENYMQLDETTRRNLELLKSMRYGTSFGSLISILNKTETAMGARKITEWLLNPLIDAEQINKRLDAVQILKEEFLLTEDIRSILKNVGDLSRILSKIGSMRVNPRDVIALRNYLDTAPLLAKIISELDNQLLSELHSQIVDYSEIIDLIDSAIEEEAPLQITDGNIIKDGFNKDLDELREISKSGKSWIFRLEEEERKSTGISSLKVGYNRVFGYYLEVTKTHKDKVPEHYIRKQTLVNAERYISPELKEYEAKVLGAEERIKSLEYELFSDIREELYEKVEMMQKFVEVVANLDALSNLAYLAYHNNYCRPQFNDEGIVKIINSRHPVIERILENEEFIPNDVQISDENMISLITGPNMAGKSTYLRQVGLLVIMAQMGSFIPAESADLPVFDKVFTRVGASDNLAMGQSTFLVEMIETANILNSATPNSLILLDEIGRGTSTFDGLSLAWSIVEYIHNNKKISAKTLFATHYHELTELENVLDKVKNLNVVVKEWNDEIIFLRKIERGTADQSYGIQVARLAGIPKRVISRAKQILQNLEEHELSAQGLTATARKQLKSASSQMNIFEAIIEKSDQKNEILEEIRNMDVENMTPLEAIKILSELQEKL